MVFLETLIAGVILFFVHFFAAEFHKGFSGISAQSFAAGVSVAYIFIELFPRLAASEYVRTIFIFVLVGFSLFYITEKIIYKHKTSKREKMRELHATHSVLFFLYHLMIGVVLFHLFQSAFIVGTLFFIPILFHTLTGTASLENINSTIREKLGVKVLLSLSTLIGSAIAFLFPFTGIIYDYILGFVVGSLMFIVIKDTLPEGNRGHPLYFILGILLFLVVMGILWSI